VKKSSSSSLGKLSKLQRLILVVLLEDGYARLERPTFRGLVKLLYWNAPRCLAKKELVAKSLSRALGRLEERGYIVRRFPGCWRLTAFDISAPAASGDVMAINAWARDKEHYGQLGLRGPSRESLAGFTEPLPQRKGVEVSLRC
jgi:hypothetical protein